MFHMHARFVTRNFENFAKLSRYTAPSSKQRPEELTKQGQMRLNSLHVHPTHLLVVVNYLSCGLCFGIMAKPPGLKQNGLKPFVSAF